MAESVYLLCAVTSIGCAVLLLRNYRAGRSRLLLWSSLCFVGLAINNVILVIDLVLAKQIDLAIVRNGTALISLGLMLYGLISESK